MNAMMVLRGHPVDYDGWAAAGCTGWSWADVEPAFARSAAGAFPLAELPDRNVLADAFVHAAQAVGIPTSPDLNGENNEGVGFVPVSQRRGRRFSVVNGYLQPGATPTEPHDRHGRARDADPHRGRPSGRRRLPR